MRLIPTLAAIALVAAPAMAALAPGAKAPDFTTRGAIAGKVFKVHLADQLKKGPVVLYFFPAAFTGGCNAEAHAFAEVDRRIPGGGRDRDRHVGGRRFRRCSGFSQEKCAGKFAVASAGPGVVAGYDVDLHHVINGNNATRRTSYVIGQDGRITFVHDDLNADKHVELTLAAVQKLRKM